MKNSPLVVALLFTATTLAGNGAYAQARGPSAKEVLKHGQDVGTGTGGADVLEFVPGKGLIPRSVINLGEEAVDAYLAALAVSQPPEEVLDDAARATKLAEQEVWLRRLPGRFRIKGRIEAPGMVTVQIDWGDSQEYNTIQTTLSGKVTGVADCDGVGEGVGVHCIINATWSVIDMDVHDFMSGDQRPSASERLKVLRPAMLVLGLNPDAPSVRALVVTDDSIGHILEGKLTASTLAANRPGSCFNPDLPPLPCIQALQVIAEPESGTVTMVHRAPGATLRLTMHRDPEARAEEPLKRKKAR